MHFGCIINDYYYNLNFYGRKILTNTNVICVPTFNKPNGIQLLKKNNIFISLKISQTTIKMLFIPLKILKL